MGVRSTLVTGHRGNPFKPVDYGVVWPGAAWPLLRAGDVEADILHKLSVDHRPHKGHQCCPDWAQACGELSHNNGAMPSAEEHSPRTGQHLCPVDRNCRNDCRSRYHAKGSMICGRWIVMNKLVRWT